MLINCVICSDNFDSSSNIYSTKCGHLFHYVCLLRWLDTRIRTCPQCRNVTTKNDIHKVFFNVSNETEAGNERVQNYVELHNQVGRLRATIERKERELKCAQQNLESYVNEHETMRLFYQEAREMQETAEMMNESLREQVRQLTQHVRSGEAAVNKAREDQKKEFNKKIKRVVTWRSDVGRKISSLLQVMEEMTDQIQFLPWGNRCKSLNSLRAQEKWWTLLAEIGNVMDAYENDEDWETAQHRSESINSSWRGGSLRHNRENSFDVAWLLTESVSESCADLPPPLFGTQPCPREGQGHSRRDTFSCPLPRPRRTRVRSLFDDFSDVE